MKFIAAIVVYLLISLVLGGGILLLMAGKPWLLIAGVLAYVVVFAKTGCLSH